MGKLELQKFRVLMDRQPAILAINREEKRGLKEAKDRYILMIEAPSTLVFESDDDYGAHDEAYIYRRFKDLGIVDFEFVDLEVEEEQKRVKEFSKLLEKSEEWFKTLPKEQQEMVGALIKSRQYYPACG